MDEVPAGLPRLPFRVSVSPSTNGKPHGPLAPPSARGAGSPRSDPRPPRGPRRPAPALPSAAPGAAPTASGVRRRAASASGRGGRGVPLVAVQVRPARWVTHFLFPRARRCHGAAGACVGSRVTRSPRGCGQLTAEGCGAPQRQPATHEEGRRGLCEVCGTTRVACGEPELPSCPGGREKEGTPLLGVGGPRCKRWGSRPWSESSARFYLCDPAAAPSWPVSAPVSSDDSLTSLDLSFRIC